MIPVKEALELISKHSASLTPERIDLKNALGFILAEDVISPINMPPFDQSAMDGYALNRTDAIEIYDLNYRIQAGDDASGIHLNPGECARIYTGAMIPSGCNTVIQQENTSESEGKVTIVNGADNLNIRPEGEQYKQNEIIASAGQLLNPGVIGFLASAGIQSANVYPKPKTLIIATGNELVEAGNELKKGQIYESNAIMLQSALGALNIPTDSIKLADEKEVVVKAFESALEQYDLILVSGGISVGDYDFVREAMDVNEVEEIFYKVRQKPGKPLYFGKKKHAIVFGLPGNPSSALTSFYIYVLPAIQSLTGRNQAFLQQKHVALTHDFHKKGSLTNFVRAKISEHGVTVLSHQSSAMLNAWSEANALLMIPDESNECKEGELFTAFLLPAY